MAPPKGDLVARTSTAAEPVTAQVALQTSIPGGWYARAAKGEMQADPHREGRITAAPPMAREAAHPQPIEPARQIILEWNRPAGTQPNDAEAALRTAGGRSDTAIR
jgi:hypothetical protein